MAWNTLNTYTAGPVVLQVSSNGTYGQVQVILPWTDEAGKERVEGRVNRMTFAPEDGFGHASFETGLAFADECSGTFGEALTAAIAEASAVKPPKPEAKPRKGSKASAVKTAKVDTAKLAKLIAAGIDPAEAVELLS